MKHVNWLVSALLAVSASAWPAIGGASAAATSTPHAVVTGLPLTFEPTAGPADAAEFVARGPKYAIGLNEKGAALDLGSRVIRLEVLGARAALPIAEKPLPGVVNYFIGNDPMRWRTGVKTFGQVRYSDLYPGVDLVYYGTQGRLEYDFAIAPGASAAPIRLAFAGADAVRVDAQGNLQVAGDGHEMVFERPVAYQMKDGRRWPVAASYRLSGDTVRFQLGAYDHGKRLVIDPVLSYFSYLGGSGYDVAGIEPPTGTSSYFSGQTAATDAAGDLYVAGYTNSTNFPTQSAFAPPPPKTNPNSGQSWAFVTKFAPDAKTLIFSTYLGGTGSNDRAASIAVDSSGNAVVVGIAGSHDFPVTAGAYQTVCNPQFSAPNVEVPACDANGFAGFVSKFSPSGALLHSTFLGGTGTNTSAFAVAVDASGRAYVAGQTLPGATVPAGTPGFPQAIPFPTTAGAALVTPPFSTTGGFQNVLSSQQDAFVTVFDPTLSTLVYSSLFGEPQVSNAGAGFHGASFTFGEAVTVDAAGNFYLAGTSEDGSLPTTAGAYENNASSCGTVTNNVLLNCAFVAKFSPVGSGTPSLIYGTYLGHTVTAAYGDLMTGIAADAAGDAYVTGFTNQATFPTTAGAYQTTCNQYGVNGNTNTSCASAFIAKLNPNGTALLASTYFGGYYAGANNISDSISSVGPIALDAAGNVYIDGVAGNGLPQAYPLGGDTSPSALQFVAELDSNLTTLKFSTLLNSGGAGQTVTNGLAIDSANAIYVVGSVNSPTSSAATAGAFQSAYGGGASDAFVAKIVVQSPTTTTLSATPASATFGAAVALTALVKPASGSAVPTGTVTFKNGSTALGTATLNGTGQGTFSTSTLAVGSYSVTAVYGGDNGESTSTSSAVAVTITAAPVASTTALAAAPTSAVVGTAVAFTATVTPSSGSNVPTGVVTFKDGAATLGTATLTAGKAMYSNSALAVGSHSITASYAGDAGDNASTSSAVTVTITAAAPAAPTGVTATAGNAQVTLSWTASSGATSYSIYEGTSAGGESTTAVQSGVAGTSVTITGLTSGTAYFFTVAAVNAGGAGSPSGEVSATPTSPATSGGGGGHSGGGAFDGNAVLVLLSLAALRAFRAPIRAVRM